MDDLENWDACKELAKVVTDMDAESAAYVIQCFVNRLSEGETYRMALSMSKRVWEGIPTTVYEVEKHEQGNDSNGN